MLFRSNKYSMKKTGNNWTVDIELPSGRYAYKFVVNPKDILEKEKWFTDTKAPQTKPDEYNETNSIVKIRTLKNFIFFFDLLFISLIAVIVLSSVFSYLTKRIMVLKLKLASKFVIVMLLVSFVTSFLLIFVEMRERKILVEN